MEEIAKMKPMLNPNDVLALTAKYFAVDIKSITNGHKDADAARARSASAWVFRNRWVDNPTGMTTISRLIGCADGNSISTILNRADRFRDSDPNFRRLTDELLRISRGD